MLCKISFKLSRLHGHRNTDVKPAVVNEFTSLIMHSSGADEYNKKLHLTLYVPHIHTQGIYASWYIMNINLMC